MPVNKDLQLIKTLWRAWCNDMTFSAVNALVGGHLEKVAWHNKQATKECITKRKSVIHKKNTTLLPLYCMCLFSLYTLRGNCIKIQNDPNHRRHLFTLHMSASSGSKVSRLVQKCVSHRLSGETVCGWTAGDNAIVWRHITVSDGKRVLVPRNLKEICCSNQYRDIRSTCYGIWVPV